MSGRDCSRLWCGIAWYDVRVYQFFFFRLLFESSFFSFALNCIRKAGRKQNGGLDSSRIIRFFNIQISNDITRNTTQRIYSYIGAYCKCHTKLVRPFCMFCMLHNHLLRVPNTWRTATRLRFALFDMHFFFRSHISRMSEFSAREKNTSCANSANRTHCTTRSRCL